LSPREERQNFSGDQERLHQPWTLLRPREAFSSKWNDRSTSRSGHKTGILVGRQPIVILALYFPHLFLSKNELDWIGSEGRDYTRLLTTHRDGFLSLVYSSYFLKSKKNSVDFSSCL
jgi:hypothetical protein